MLHIQLVHGFKISLDVAVGDDLPADALCIGSLDNLVIHVGKILDVLYLKAALPEITLDDIPGYKRTGVADMGMVVGGDAADIHAHLARLLRHKFFFFPCHGIVDFKHFYPLTPFSVAPAPIPSHASPSFPAAGTFPASGHGQGPAAHHD